MLQNVFDKGKLKAIIRAVYHPFTFFAVLCADKQAFQSTNTQTVDKKYYEKSNQEIHWWLLKRHSNHINNKNNLASLPFD